MPSRAFFWNLIAKRYAKAAVPDEVAYQRKLDAAISRLSPQSRVLEIGCGTGTTAVHLAPYAGSVDAVDISPKMLAIGRERAQKAGVTNIAFREGSVEDFEADAASYDMVMMHSLLHLLPDPAAAVATAAKHVVPGGWFLTSTTCLGNDGLRGIALAIRPFSALRLLPRLTVFSQDDLRGMIAGAGFEIAEDWKPQPKAAVFIAAKKLG